MRISEVYSIIRLLGLIICSFLFSYIMVIYIKGKRKSQKEFYIKPSKKNKSYRLLKLYNQLTAFRPAQRYLEKLRKTYEVRIPGSTRECKEAAMRLALCVWAVDIAAVAVAVIMDFSVYVVGCCLFTAYFVNDQIVTHRVEECDNAIIRDLDTFTDLVQFHYLNIGMVDEALLLAIQETKSSLMKAHGQQIYDVLLETVDFEEAVKEYNIRNTDYFVKMFAENIFVTHQYGDKIVNEESLFTYTLRSLKNEIRDELIKRRKISSKFAHVPYFIAAPIYTLDLIKNVGAGSFSTLTDIYNGSYGSICAVCLFIMEVLVYQIAKRLRSFVKVEKENALLLQSIYSVRPIKRMIDSMAFRNWGKTLRLKISLKKVGSSINELQFLTKKVVYFVLTFMATLVFLNALHVRNHTYYVSNVVDIGNSTSGSSDEEGFQMVMLGRYYVDKYKVMDIRKEYNAVSGLQPSMFFDQEIQSWLSTKILNELHTEEISVSEQEAFELLQKYFSEHEGMRNNLVNLKGVSYEEASTSDDHMIVIGMHYLQSLVEKTQISNALTNESLNKIVADKVAQKIQKSQNEYFHWWELIVVFGFALLAYQIPSFLMWVDKKAFQMDMEDEIVQFQSVIFCLMYVERMTVEKILEWMLMFSRIFEDSLRKCVNDMPLDEEKALDELKESEPFEPFGRLVNNLIMSDKVGILHAFDNLRSDRKAHREKRKLENEISIEKKSGIAGIIIFVPILSVTIFYFIVPFMLAAVGEFTNALQESTSILGGA